MTDQAAGQPLVAFEASLGRNARQGNWSEIAQGTFGAATRALMDGRSSDAVDLLDVSILEADELRDVYGQWPQETVDWILARGVPETEVTEAINQLTELIGMRAMAGIESEWPAFTAAIAFAKDLCSNDDPGAPRAIENARVTWLAIHDRAVDRVSGLIDIAVRLVGEDHLGNLWDYLMSDWYAVHEARYDVTRQPWSESASQLMIAIVDGFHAHLTGPDRSGDIEVIEQPDRIGFRFAPCGSGGRSVSTGITDDRPRAAAPYGFAVTTAPHDWAWNMTGICSYCVHCCRLNELMPIDRLGYPTRVIDPPTWPTEDENPTCTWWVYRDPSLVPDAVYTRVGRSPSSRPISERNIDGEVEPL
jgi:hypothetical protein